MEKDTKRAVIEFVGAVVLIVAIIVGLMFLTRETDRSDGLKFKSEYEALNNTIRESDGQKYGEINIPEKNPMKYITPKEALDVLDSESAIIYVGAPWCPWCRGAVPVLIELANKNKVDTIYYLELDDVKSNYKVENGSLVKTSPGTDDYYKLLEKLADHLDDYIITDDGKKYDTGEKRIYMPYVVAVRNGEVVKDKIGTVTLDEGQSKYGDLTDEQNATLSEEYQIMFDLALGKIDGSCEDGEACN